LIPTLNSTNQLVAIAQDRYPIGTIIGSLALLDKEQYLFAACAGDNTTNIITLPAACPLQSGWPCYASIPGVGGSLPIGLHLGTKYYAIRVSATEIQLAATFADAQAGIAIALGTAGVGVTIAETPALITDPLGLILLHELPLATRAQVASTAITTPTAALALVKFSSSVANSTGGVLTVGRQVLIYGGSTVVGSTAGNEGFSLSDRLLPPLSIAAGQTFTFAYDVEITN
jgi:hypothetical protein